jgi:hypothetical protein
LVVVHRKQTEYNLQSFASTTTKILHHKKSGPTKKSVSKNNNIFPPHPPLPYRSFIVMRRKQTARIHVHRARIKGARFRAVVGAGGDEIEEGTEDGWRWRWGWGQYELAQKEKKRNCESKSELQSKSND